MADGKIENKIDQLLHDTIIQIEHIKNCVLHKAYRDESDKRTLLQRNREAEHDLEILHDKLHYFRHSLEFKEFLYKMRAK